MAGSKRNPTERERALQEVASLYLSGHTQVDIAARLGVVQSQVSYDLAMLRKRWRASSLRDFDEARAQELAKIDRLELEYWTAWQRSIQKRETTHKESAETTGGRRAKASVRTEDMLGNPAYLAGVQWCIERRCTLLGLDAPSKVAGEVTVKVIRGASMDDL